MGVGFAEVDEDVLNGADGLVVAEDIDGFFGAEVEAFGEGGLVVVEGDGGGLAEGVGVVAVSEGLVEGEGFEAIEPGFAVIEGAASGFEGAELGEDDGFEGAGAEGLELLGGGVEGVEGGVEVMAFELNEAKVGAEDGFLFGDADGFDEFDGLAVDGFGGFGLAGGA